MRWTETDKSRVRAILDRISAETNQAELGRQLGDLPRYTVNNWHRRGRVPIEHHHALIAAGAKIGLTITPDQLHPAARALLKGHPTPRKNAA